MYIRDIREIGKYSYLVSFLKVISMILPVSLLWQQFQVLSKNAARYARCGDFLDDFLMKNVCMQELCYDRIALISKEGKTDGHRSQNKKNQAEKPELGDPDNRGHCPIPVGRLWQ